MIDYDERLKAALTSEPQQINSLLYRTFSTQEDYEENTYLDLYIYQTGRNSGNLPAVLKIIIKPKKFYTKLMLQWRGKK